MEQSQIMLWLSAVLTDKHRRTLLQSLMQQYELPVIQLKAVHPTGHRNQQQCKRIHRPIIPVTLPNDQHK